MLCNIMVTILTMAVDSFSCENTTGSWFIFMFSHATGLEWVTEIMIDTNRKLNRLNKLLVFNFSLINPFNNQMSYSKKLKFFECFCRKEKINSSCLPEWTILSNKDKLIVSPLTMMILKIAENLTFFKIILEMAYETKFSDK